ncbi:hypothetical protein P3102_21890 [Amycolatopsis sp. QT-25]|uniref:hypothetical protein n=1 Tax=Amycolatopsis sp. QT-25 TaxID=3034022 RepID=UPI0023EBAABF|nr:hypothetical protein [Amycolatopsis sp. QT-25]WET76761.1 hypothetical protein P3102_21890 [Amycolatopsis sp. QT-25]
MHGEDVRQSHEVQGTPYWGTWDKQRLCARGSGVRVEGAQRADLDGRAERDTGQVQYHARPRDRLPRGSPYGGDDRASRRTIGVGLDHDHFTGLS